MGRLCLEDEIVTLQTLPIRTAKKEKIEDKVLENIIFVIRNTGFCSKIYLGLNHNPFAVHLL
jgi:hypothetical protein